MRPPTLLGDLLRVQTLIAVLSGLLVGLGGLAATVILLRKSQDRTLRTLAGSVCHTIEQERKEDPSIRYADAARGAFTEMALPQFLLEIQDLGGVLLVSEGALRDWSSRGLEGMKHGGCVTRRRPGHRTLVGASRACVRYCDADHRILVATADVHGNQDVRRAVRALLAMFLMALGAGVFVGRGLIRRRLRPLHRLERAATRLHAGTGTSLGAGARPLELARLEEAFDRLLQQLHEALQREKRFTQEASHELRTSLTVIRARVEVLAGGLGSLPDLRSEAEALIRSLDSLDRLVEALLLLARSEQAAGLPGEPVNLCDLARETADERSRADGPGSPPPEVQVPDEILVRGSEELLGRALSNLLENARKFGGPGARIRIRVAGEDGRALLTVEDDGPGIPAEMRPYVFERFFRTPSQRGRVPGTGLGLAVVRSIARSHGGDVSTEASETLGGEAVRLWLPLLGVEAPSPSRASSVQGSAA